MTRRRAVLAGIALAILVTSTSSSTPTRAADDRSVPPNTEPAESGADPTKPATTPMIDEIEAVINAARARTQELQARLALTTEEESVRVLQDEVEVVKFGAYLRIFEIQRDWARRQGRDDVALRLTAVIETMHARRGTRPTTEIDGGPAVDPR